MTPVEERIDHHERDYLERTIATVRNHRDAENCWPSWANIFADEIERLWKVEEALLTEHSAREEREKAFALASRTIDRLEALLEDRERTLREAVERGNWVEVRRIALPATESAQPEEPTDE